jgi:hypothetical protein
MLNLFQHLIKSMYYETLNQVQGDKRVVFQQPAKYTEREKSAVRGFKSIFNSDS